MKIKYNKTDIIKIKSIEIMFSLILTTVIIATLIILLKKSFIKESIIAFSIIWILMFCFFIVGLYKGIRIRKDNKNKKEVIGDSSGGGYDFSFIEGAFSAGIEGLIFGIIASIIFAVVVVFLLSTVFPIIGEIGAVVIAGINFAIMRLFRRVLILRKKCRGNLIESIKYSFLNTTLYVGIIFGLFLISVKIIEYFIK